MNEFDRENLEYLMSCSEQEFNEWADSMDVATIAYMLKVIRKERERMEMEELDYMNDCADADTTEAEEILKRFTLKG